MCVRSFFTDLHMYMLYINIGNPGNNNRNYQAFVVHNIRNCRSTMISMPALHMLVYILLPYGFIGAVSRFIMIFNFPSHTKHISKHLPISMYTSAARYDKYEVNLLKITIFLDTVSRVITCTNIISCIRIECIT